MANIQKRVSQDGEVSYRVRVRKKGHPMETATFKRLTDAKRWAQQVEATITEGRHFKTAESKRHTIADLIDRYIEDVLPTKSRSMQQQRQQLEWWREQIGMYSLADVTPALIVEHRDKLKKGITHKGTPRSTSTVNRYLAALSHAFTVGVNEWAWLEDSPMRKVSKLKEPPGRVRYLSDEERERLLEVCKAHKSSALYPIVIIGLSTGLRKSVIAGLSWEQVDLERKRIVISDPERIKNRGRFGVPLAKPALEVLEALDKVRRPDTNLVFPSQKIPSQPVDIRSAWETSLKRAGIEDFRFHDTRHCTGSWLAMSGASDREIAEILGHKTLQMVKRYSHLSESHTASVVERMAEKFLG